MIAVLRKLSLLLLTIPLSSIAMGLGEVDLKSNLGERLNANINLSDIESSPESSCFSVSDINEPPAFKKAVITLTKTASQYLLNIQSTEVITEPIVNLRVATHCEPNINRDYVILLDPAVTVEEKPTQKLNPIAQVATNNSTKNTSAPKSKKQKKTSSTVNQVDVDINPDLANQTPQYKKRKKYNKESAIDKKLMESYTGTNQSSQQSQIKQDNQDETPRKNQNLPPSKPYLTLSGESTQISNNEASHLSLRLEKQIDFSRTETQSPVLSPSEVIDEVTVMTNRLAHLEKQILTLQSQNQRLKIEAQESSASFSWTKIKTSLNTFLVSLIVLASLPGIAWLRHKILLKRLSSEQARWFDADLTDERMKSLDHPSTKKSLFAKESNHRETSSSSSEPFETINSSLFTYPSAFTVNESTENESVLDHAEVFIAHDRPAMAIQLLQNHLVDLPVESPEIWLKLISLLAHEGSEEEYNKAVTACKQFFNVKLPSFANATDIDESSLEDYPHIVTRLQEVWGSEFAVDFLNDLIYNKQSQPREGFGRQTFKELFTLKLIALTLNASNKTGTRAHATPHTFSNPESNPLARIAPMSATAQSFASAEADPIPEERISENHVIDAHLSEENPIVETQPVQHSIDEKLTAESFLNAPDAVENDIEFSFDVEDPIEPNKDSSSLDFELSSLFSREKTPEIKTNSKAEAVDLALNSPTLDINAPLEAEEIDFSTFLEDITMEDNNQALATTEANALPETQIVLEENFENETFEAVAEQPKVAKVEAKRQKAPLTIDWELPKSDQ